MGQIIFSTVENYCTNKFEDWDEDNEPPPCRDKDCSTCPYHQAIVIPKIVKEEE